MKKRFGYRNPLVTDISNGVQITKEEVLLPKVTFSGDTLFYDLVSPVGKLEGVIYDQIPQKPETDDTYIASDYPLENGVIHPKKVFEDVNAQIKRVSDPWAQLISNRLKAIGKINSLKRDGFNPQALITKEDVIVGMLSGSMPKMYGNRFAVNHGTYLVKEIIVDVTGIDHVLYFLFHVESVYQYGDQDSTGYNFRGFVFDEDGNRITADGNPIEIDELVSFSANRSISNFPFKVPSSFNEPNGLGTVMGIYASDPSVDMISRLPFNYVNSNPGLPGAQINTRWGFTSDPVDFDSNDFSLKFDYQTIGPSSRDWLGFSSVSMLTQNNRDPLKNQPLVFVPEDVSPVFRIKWSEFESSDYDFVHKGFTVWDLSIPAASYEISRMLVYGSPTLSSFVANHACANGTLSIDDLPEDTNVNLQKMLQGFTEGALLTAFKTDAILAKDGTVCSFVILPYSLSCLDILTQIGSSFSNEKKDNMYLSASETQIFLKELIDIDITFPASENLSSFMNVSSGIESYSVYPSKFMIPKHKVNIYKDDKVSKAVYVSNNCWMTSEVSIGNINN